MIQNMIQQQHSINIYKHGQQQLTCTVELNAQEYYLMQMALQGASQQLQ